MKSIKAAEESRPLCMYWNWLCARAPGRDWARAAYEEQSFYGFTRGEIFNLLKEEDFPC